jgi:hypothetical protein
MLPIPLHDLIPLSAGETGLTLATDDVIKALPPTQNHLPYFGRPGIDH